jgi:hypothetical protein
MTTGFETPPMFTDCVIPGCRNLVSDANDACDACRAAFGPYLVFSPARRFQRTSSEPCVTLNHDHPNSATARSMAARSGSPKSSAGYANSAEPVQRDPVVGNATGAEPSPESSRLAWVYRRANPVGAAPFTE